MKQFVVAATVVAVVAVLGPLAGCARDEAPAATPLPTKEKTIGCVQQQLEKADEDAAKRREAIDAVGK